MGSTKNKTRRNKKNRFISTVLKSYLAFLFLIIGLLAFGPTDEIEGHTAVIIGTEYNLSDTFDVNFESSVSYVVPGDDEVKVLEMSILAKENPIRICDLKFKVFGLSEDEVDAGISGAILTNEGGKKFIGTVEDGYISFPGIFKKLYPGVGTTYSLFIDFSKRLEAGSRVSFGFEKPENLGITISGEKVFQKLQYPVYGPYFSTVNHFTSILN